jgi:heptosyltransferase-3
VVVHPGASVPARAWAPEANAKLVARLVALGRQVVVTGGPSERALCAQVAAGAPGVVDLSGTTDFAGMAEVLAGADAVVVGNTGPAHLAAAVGTPVVSLYAPTVPAVRWHPWGVPHVLLGSQDIACAGCRSRVCPIPGQPCLGVVEVDDVVAAVASLADATLGAA